MLTDDATAALVLRSREGDPEAFEALVRAYLRAAYSVALAVVGRPADAEDVAQDAMLVAFERLDTCREPARFAGWLLQIVRNRARNWLDQRRLRDVPKDDTGPEQSNTEPLPEQALLRGRLLEALHFLNSNQREVVLLHDLEGWTHPEIAEALGVSEVMSRQHLFNARKILRERLAEDAPSEVDHGRG